MSKLNLILGFSYCQGRLQDSACTKKEECKRYLNHYKVTEQCLWFVTAHDCIINDHRHFIKLEVQDAYDSLNKDLIKIK